MEVVPGIFAPKQENGETSLGVGEGGRKASGGGYNQNSTLKNKNRK